MANEDQVRFLESMITQYESLVQDMNVELNSSQQSLKYHNGNNNDRNDNIDNGNITYWDQQSQINEMSQEISRQNIMIENLRTQLVTANKSKKISKQLWQSTLEHLESSKQTSLKILPAVDFISKWKLLQSYTLTLEKQIERYTNEVSFFRKKILEIRLENDISEKKAVAANSKILEQTKASYEKEIVYLKTKVGNLRQELEESFGKRLDIEKKSWEYQEAQTLKLVKVKVEQLLKDNKHLERKERSDASIIRNLTMELFDVKSHLALALVRCNLENACKSTNSNENRNVVIDSRSKRTTASIPKKTQTENLDFINKDIIFMKKEYQNLQSTHETLLRDLKVKEEEFTQHNLRLSERISKLEFINSKIKKQLLESENKCASLGKEQEKTKKEKMLCKCTLEDVEHVNATTADKEIKLQPSWKIKDDFINTENPNEMLISISDYDIQRVQVFNLQQQLFHLKYEREKLLNLISKQQAISVKWKDEFKELARQIVSNQNQNESEKPDVNKYNYN